MRRSNWTWVALLAALAWWGWGRRTARDGRGVLPYEPVEREARRAATDAGDAAAWEAESGAMRDA